MTDQTTAPTSPERPSRRNLMLGGLLGAATLAAASGASAQQAGRFAGKSILVTGGNSGIGAATVRAFAREGARVMFVARRDALGRDVEAEVRAAGGDATWRQTDVRDPVQVRAAVDATINAHGRIDALVNNAGIFMTPGPLPEIEIDNYRDMMATNVDGVFYGMKYALPAMTGQGSGVIVNMASVAAHRGFGVTAHYNASKHAVIGLTKAAATTAAKQGVRVVSLSPLAVDTPMLRESFEYQGFTYDAMAPHFVTPRIMAAEEIAETILFLASDAAAPLNGMDLDVTGGQLA